MQSIEDIRRFMIRWNRRFPIDRWYREKHNIAFLSEEHRKSSFLNQLAEFQEYLYFKEKNDVKTEENDYIPNVGDMFKKDVIDTSKGIDQISIEEFRKEMKQFELNNGRQED